MEKIWLRSYEPGVASEIDAERYSSINDVFRQSVERFRDNPGFTNMNVCQTFGETAGLVDQFASFLQNTLKLSKGERVAVMMPNLLQYPVAVFGILQAGLVVVNVNPLYTPRELEHQLKDSGAGTIIVMENFANTLELVLPKTAVKNVIVTGAGDLLGTFKGMLVNFAVRHIKKMVPQWRIDNAISFKDALKAGKAQPFREVGVTLDDLAFLQYTGGTTGIAKGAMLTHGNICANMLQAEEWIKNKIVPGQEIVVTPLPLYHIFSLTINLMIFVMSGGKNILITNPRDLDGFIKELKSNKITVFIGLNTLFNGLLHKEEFQTVDFSTWKLTLSGGMAAQKSVADRWHQVSGTPVINAYGLTECSPGVCVNPLSTNNAEYEDTIGLPLPSTDIELRDENRRPVALGESGELWVKGPQVMKGYWQRPEETQKVMDNQGFVATGDVGIMSENGFVRLIDRKKDLIVVSGFNVYPNEIEDVVAEMPGVMEVACVGVPSEKTGEALKLFIVKKDENLGKEDIIAHCRKELTGYKVPKIIEFRDELPKSNVGKILRRELRGQ